MHLRIHEAAEQIGVSVATLKRWLLSKKVRDVGRDRNGWRVFTIDDIQRLRKYASGDSFPEGSLFGDLILTNDPAPESPIASRYSVSSFFSGIGGFDLGFERAGFSIKLQCEIEPFCNIILEKHWPNVKRLKDIKEVTNEDIPNSDVWVGGFPCQDLSLARMGTRAGLRGSKSGLFYEFIRLAGNSLPRIILLENVAGLLNSHKGRDFGIVISALAELGYAVGWRTFNSQYFGVPQSRQRVYIVGCYRDGKGPGEILFEPECGEGDFAKSRQDGKKASSAFQRIIGDPGGAGPVIQSIAYCLYATSARHTGTDWSRNYVCYPKLGLVRRLIPSECEGVMAFPVGWTLVDGSGLSGDDLDSARYHALGNAVTPPVAKWLADNIKKYLDKVYNNQDHSFSESEKVSTQLHPDTTFSQAV